MGNLNKTQFHRMFNNVYNKNKYTKSEIYYIKTHKMVKELDNLSNLNIKLAREIIKSIAEQRFEVQKSKDANSRKVLEAISNHDKKLWIDHAFRLCKAKPEKRKVADEKPQMTKSKKYLDNLETKLIEANKKSKEIEEKIAKNPLLTTTDFSFVVEKAEETKIIEKSEKMETNDKKLQNFRLFCDEMAENMGELDDSIY
ncbi:hypothetical protein MHBO_001162 [Bonamia ostreae]|uniref:Uncharacterized protein n=1 Tax=Bonamia ostreae TaxID=126728 RepID=A0ABV2AI04_9EUKA